MPDFDESTIISGLGQIHTDIEQKHSLREGQGVVMAAIQTYLTDRPLTEVRGIVTAPTGFGKTTVFSEVIKEFFDRKSGSHVAIFVPTIDLEEQTIEELRSRGYTGRISLATNTKKDSEEPGVTISTYQGLVSRQRGGLSTRHFGMNPSLYDLVILDEGHHALATGARNILETDFSHAAMLGFTATARYNKGRELRSLLPDFIASLSVAETAEQQLISPFQCLSLHLDLDMSSIPIVNGEYDPGSVNRVMNTTGVNMAIAEWYNEHFGQFGHKGLFNHNTVEHATQMADVLRSFGLRFVPVHGGLPKRERRNIIAALKSGKLDGVTQAKVLGEGFNAPNLSVAMNVGPTLSPLKEQQRSGRVLRIDPNDPDKVGWIVDCVGHHFRVDPVLYGSPQASNCLEGGWKSASQVQSQRRLDKLSSFGAKQSSDGQIIAIKQVTGNSMFEYVDPPRIPDSEPERQRGRPPSDTSKGYSNLRTPTLNQAQNQAIERLHQRRLQTRSKHDYWEDEDTPQSAYEQLMQFNESVQLSLAVFVLEGTQLAGLPSLSDIKATLRSLAGTEELMSDSRILYRYQQLNALAQKIQSGEDATETFQALMNRSRRAPHIKKKLRVPFTHPDAACKPPPLIGEEYVQDHVEEFFPDRGESIISVKAKCFGCIAIEECLQFSLRENIKHGVWGGMSEKQRRKVRKIEREEGQEAARAQIAVFRNKDQKRVDRFLAQEALGVTVKLPVPKLRVV